MPTQALDESLEEMLNEEVVIEIASPGMQDAYGKRGYAAPQTYRARLDADTRAIRTTTGEEATSRLQVYVLSLDQHSVEDRLTLPPTYRPDKPPILAVEPIQDEGGQTMTVFYT